jgi:hypothetical protein
MTPRDERIWWSLTKAHQRDLERLAKREGMSLSEVMHLARVCADLSIDPAPGRGPCFVFVRDDFVTRDYFASAAVPPPDANVDYDEAWQNCKDDQRAFIQLLDEANHRDERLPLPVLLAGFANQLNWYRFYARRAAKPDQRQWFAAQAEDIQAVLEEVNARIEARRLRC